MCWCDPQKRTPWCDNCHTVRPDLASDLGDSISQPFEPGENTPILPSWCIEDWEKESLEEKILSSDGFQFTVLLENDANKTRELCGLYELQALITAFKAEAAIREKAEIEKLEETK